MHYPFWVSIFFITNASSQLSLQKTTISIGISTRQSDSLTSFKCKKRERERERERDCVNFCTHCSSSTLWFPCQRFKTFFGCQEMDLWWLVAQILPWYTCWRIWHTSHSELLAETPTCPSLAGKDWGQDLWSTGHPDNVINSECMKHLELPWSLTHRNGQSPCEQVCHHLM